MNIYPKKLSASELKEIETRFENDLKSYMPSVNEHCTDGLGGRDVQRLLRHIAYLQAYVELLTVHDKHDTDI